MVSLDINIQAYNRESAQTDFVRAPKSRADFAVDLHPVQLLPVTLNIVIWRRLFVFGGRFDNTHISGRACRHVALLVGSPLPREMWSTDLTSALPLCRGPPC